MVATAATLAIGLMGAPSALADEEAVAPSTTTIGQQGKLVNGDVVQGWTITGLKPSADEVPFTPSGTLWEATATNEAIQGSVQPIVSNLNARAADGQNYRVLWGLATTQGVNPAALAQGEKTSGKVYFDVTGASPDSIVYNAGGRDLLVWEPAPAASPSTGGGGTWTPPATGGYQSAPAQSAPAQTAPAPAAGSAGTPITEGTPAAPEAAGSAGTPITEGAPAAPEATGSAGTPVTEGTPVAPAPAAGSAGTPVTEGTPVAPAPAAGSAGTPVTEGTPVAPAPAAGSAGTPAVEGSAGTPVGSVPTTTVVPHGSQYAPAS